MSKTAEEIGLIVGGIALAATGFAAYEGVLAFGLSMGQFQTVLGLSLSATLSGLGMALRVTPPSLGTTNRLAFDQGSSYRRTIYGQQRGAGVLTYASFPPQSNQSLQGQFIHLVYTLTAHEILSFDAVIINGTVRQFGVDIVWVPGTPTWSTTGTGVFMVLPYGVATTLYDFYAEQMFFEFDFGRPLATGPPFPCLDGADPAWTSACLQRGCAKVHVILQYNQDRSGVYQNGAIPNIEFLITGKKMLDPRIQTAWLGSTGYVEYQYFVDNRGIVWTQTNSSGTSSATASRPNFEGSGTSWPVTVADNTLSWTTYGFGQTQISEGVDGSPQGHFRQGRLVNDAWAASSGYYPGYIIEAPWGYLQMATNTGTAGVTEPNFALTLGGTTTDNTQDWVCLGRSWHAVNPSNPALIVNDYLQDDDFGMNAAIATIDEVSVQAAANVCEEQALIIWNADNTVVYENLYSCDGMFDQSSERGKVLDQICATMAGYAIQPGDLWHVIAGGYVTPSVALGDNDFRDAIKGDFRISRRDTGNSIKGTYTPSYLPANPATDLSLTSIPAVGREQGYPPWQSAAYIAADGGQIIWKDANFDFVKSLWQAQRLAKIALLRLRFQQSITLPCKLSAFALEAADTVYVSHARWNFVYAVFEVVQCSLVADRNSKGAPALGIDLTLRQSDPSIFEFIAPTSVSDYGDYSPFGITGILVGPH